MPNLSQTRMIPGEQPPEPSPHVRYASSSQANVSCFYCRAPSIRSERDNASSARLSSPPASLYEQHVADFPRIHRPVPRRGRFMRSTSPRISERPGTTPLPSGPLWGRSRTIPRTPVPLPADEETERAVTPRPASSGPNLDCFKTSVDNAEAVTGHLFQEETKL
jgi:hypothetical protein